MFRKHMPIDACRTLAMFTALFIASCSAAPPVLSVSEYEYPAGTAGIGSYRVEFSGTPDFLKPMLRDEASRVLAEKGLRYTEGDADAVLLMTFINEPLPSDSYQAGSDSIDGESTAVETAARFDARVRIEMTNSVNHERIWAGTLSRVHYVTEGDYMHETPARVAMRRAFSELFAGYPVSQLELISP